MRSSKVMANALSGEVSAFTRLASIPR
jgi:hypothetical protein